MTSALGADVLCGANYSCHPFYYPHSTMYVKWFREGAADLGRHSEYFWQVGPGRADDQRLRRRAFPRRHARQPQRPCCASTPCRTRRATPTPASCAPPFSHLAHGATMLDFFGIGMNETFTENYIDHRDHAALPRLRDVTHAVGLVEDMLPKSRPVPSPVALLLSAEHRALGLRRPSPRTSAGHDLFGPNFRKMRLNAHLDRLGLWTALTFLGASPDLLIEEDVNEKGLKDYKVLVVVGDCLPPSLAPALEAWVRKGGVVLATANAGRYDPYRAPTPVFEKLFGLESRQSEERPPSSGRGRNCRSSNRSIKFSVPAARCRNWPRSSASPRRRTPRSSRASRRARGRPSWNAASATGTSSTSRRCRA